MWLSNNMCVYLFMCYITSCNKILLFALTCINVKPQLQNSGYITNSVHF